MCDNFETEGGEGQIWSKKVTYFLNDPYLVYLIVAEVLLSCDFNNPVSSHHRHLTVGRWTDTILCSCLLFSSLHMMMLSGSLAH